MTAYADVETTIKALKRGAYDYLQKPLHPQELAATLERCFEKIHLERENQRTTAASRESEERYRSIFENALEGIFRSTPEGYFIDANPALVDMLGYQSAAEVLALKLPEYLYLSLSEWARLQDLFAAQGLARGVELTWKKEDRTAVIVNLNAQTSYDAQGQIRFYEGMVQDITERKQLEEQFHQSQKMEAIRQLASGVAHDFNNIILTVIIGFSGLLLRQLGDDKPLCKDVEEISKAGMRAADLTRQLLIFSRQQVIQPKILNLNTIVADVEKLLRRLIGEDIELVTRLEESLGQIKADPGQLEQVILNLAVNARDAMPQGGKLTIETVNTYLDQAQTRRHMDAKTGAYVMLVMQDTGVGMEAAVKSRIFDPFFTTKEQGKGTDLGLSTVHGIIKQSGGIFRSIVHLDREQRQNLSAQY